MAKLEVGNVLVRRGSLEPFIIEEIHYRTEDQYEITCRKKVQPDGRLKVSNRRVDSRSGGVYEFISKKYMDKDYVLWAIANRGGLYRVPQESKPALPMLDVVKAVFYRQNRLLNPGITIQEVESLWDNNYFPLYTQVRFEMQQVLTKTGNPAPLNFEPSGVVAPSGYVDKLTRASSYTVTRRKFPLEENPPKFKAPIYIPDHLVSRYLLLKLKLEVMAADIQGALIPVPDDVWLSLLNDDGFHLLFIAVVANEDSLVLLSGAGEFFHVDTFRLPKKWCPPEWTEPGFDLREMQLFLGEYWVSFDALWVLARPY